MNEIVIRLEHNGAAIVPGRVVVLGYMGNRGNYRLRIEARNEWENLTIRAHWHTPGGCGTTLVQQGLLDVPAAVTAVPGTGCITFEGTDGERTVTSADVTCKVCANSGTVDGTMPQPGTPAWEAFVDAMRSAAGGIGPEEKSALLTVLRPLAEKSANAANAYNTLARLWGGQLMPEESRTTARLGLAALGRMILGGS